MTTYVLPSKEFFRVLFRVSGKQSDWEAEERYINSFVCVLLKQKRLHHDTRDGIPRTDLTRSGAGRQAAKKQVALRI